MNTNAHHCTGRVKGRTHNRRLQYLHSTFWSVGILWLRNMCWRRDSNSWHFEKREREREGAVTMDRGQTINYKNELSQWNTPQYIWMQFITAINGDWVQWERWQLHRIWFLSDLSPTPCALFRKIHFPLCYSCSIVCGAVTGTDSSGPFFCFGRGCVRCDSSFFASIQLEFRLALIPLCMYIEHWLDLCCQVSVEQSMGICAWVAYIR